MRGVAILLLLVLGIPSAAQAESLANAQIAPQGEIASVRLDAAGKHKDAFLIAPASVSVPVKLAHARVDGQDLRAAGPARTGGGVQFDDIETADPNTWAPQGSLNTPVATIQAQSEGSSLVHHATKKLEKADAKKTTRGQSPRVETPTAIPSMPQAGDAPGARAEPGHGIALRNEAIARAQSTSIPRAVPIASAAQAAWRTIAMAAAGFLFLLLVPIALYHRLRGAQALESSQRAKLLDIVRQTPGVPIAEIARDLGIDPSTARYHVRRLVKEGILVTQEGVGCFVAGAVPRAQRAGLAAVEGREEVLAAIRATPGQTVTDLAKGLGVGRSTMRWHLTKLAQARLVALVRDGRGVRVRPEAFE